MSKSLSCCVIKRSGKPKTQPAILCLLALLATTAACDLEDQIRKASDAATSTPYVDETRTTTTKQPHVPLYRIPVLTLVFLPLGEDGRLARNIVGSDLPNNMLDTSLISQKIDSLEDDYIETIRNASRFRGYDNPDATPSVGHVRIARLVFAEAVPVLTDGTYRTDKKKYLGWVNICDYVDNQGIREVWVWMYHNDGVATPIESDMSMGTAIEEFWTHPDYGDISNSYRLDTLPVCESTYTVYEFNYGRSAAMMLHSFGHQIEAIMGHMDWNLFWGGFAGYSGEERGRFPTRCGSVHWTPNSTTENVSWDENDAGVRSDCQTWNPDLPGEPEMVGCRTWFADECVGDEGKAYLTWWMQSLPGRGNELTLNGREMRNWWEFIGDFDSAIKAGESLTYPQTPHPLSAAPPSLHPPDKRTR